MASQLIWLPLLLLIYHMDRVEGNYKPHDTHLKSGKAESAIGNPVITLDLNTRFHNRLCKCKVPVRREENSCTCTKSARRKSGRAKLRRLCQRKKMKHLKICQQGPHHPIVPI